MSTWKRVFGGRLILGGLSGFLFCLALIGGTPKKALSKPKISALKGLSEEKILALGERMYREGILPNGEPMQSVVSGDIPVSGTAFTCVSCHVRSGLGSLEGGYVTLPTNGARLSQDRYWKFPFLNKEERKDLRVKTQVARVAYTDESLAHVINTGIDPSGRELNRIMPRYAMSDEDMAILVRYLWSLSATLSPGADGNTIRFATVITDEVSAADQEAMLVPMNNYVARHNTHINGMGNRMYMSIGGKEMAGAYRLLSLSVWRLTGAPETWGRQLEEKLAKEPVFALIGGISYREWQPIHAFCESHKLPCLFPITDLPVISDTDWYTQYFSKGHYQEGLAAARFLNSLPGAGASGMLQIIQDGAPARETATGFRETWKELGQGDVKEIHLPAGEALSATSLRDILLREKPTTLLLWTGAGTFEALGALQEDAGHPEKVFVSSRLLGSKLSVLPEKVRSYTYITYPYRDPKDEATFSVAAKSLLNGLTTYTPESRISTRTYSMLQILQVGLVDMDRNTYRDNLLDRIGMQRDQVLPDYPRLSFGPGQRYASKGCYIMQVGAGPGAPLLRKSEWVIH